MIDGVEVVTRDGLRFYVNPRDERGKILIETSGEFNAKSVRIFQSLLARRQWELVIDIGSNYGEMIAALTQYDAARVVAFEPNCSLHSYLKHTAKENNVYVDLQHCAVGKTSGHEMFMVDTHWSGRSSLKFSPDSCTKSVQSVEVVTLDEFFNSSTCSTALLKIDVEGFELEVLEGSRKFLSSLEEYAIQIEILHMKKEDIAMLANQWRMYFFSTESLAPIRLPGGETSIVDLYLESGYFYVNDAVLLPL